MEQKEAESPLFLIPARTTEPGRRQPARPGTPGFAGRSCGRPGCRRKSLSPCCCWRRQSAIAPAATFNGVSVPAAWVSPMMNGSTSVTPMIAARVFTPALPRYVTANWVATIMARNSTAKRSAVSSSSGFLGSNSALYRLRRSYPRGASRASRRPPPGPPIQEKER